MARENINDGQLVFNNIALRAKAALAGHGLAT